MTSIDDLKTIINDQEKEMIELISSDKIIRREYPVSKLKYAHGAANIITGPRRSGKSVFAFQVLEDKGKFGYVNFEDARLNIKAEELNKVLEAIYAIKGDTRRFLFDEIQNVAGWEKFISRLVDSKDIVITGSNSNLLSRELGSAMTGRHVNNVILPFSFREFLSYNKFKYDLSKGLSTIEKVGMIKQLEKYLYSGGFPLGIELGRQYLEDLHTDIIFKDVVVRHKIKLSAKIRELADYMSSLSASEVSYNKLKDAIGITGKHTLKEWVSFLEEAYLIIILKRFSFKRKESIKSPIKIYSIDPGFIEISSVGASVSKRMETAVSIELLRKKNYSLREMRFYYWKNAADKEVDFVVNYNGSIIQLIQVTYASDRSDIKDREVGNLLVASKELHCGNLLVITWDYEAEENIKGKKIKFIPLWKWLLNI